MLCAVGAIAYTDLIQMLMLVSMPAFAKVVADWNQCKSGPPPLSLCSYFCIYEDAKTGTLGPRGMGHQPSAASGATDVRKNFHFGMATQMGGGLI